MSSRALDARTRTVRSGLATDLHHGAVVPPIHLSSTFTFEGFDTPREYDYTRSGNPTRDLLAGALADLEGGARAVVTPTGMAAVHLALQLVDPGDLVVAPFDPYGGTHRLLASGRRRGLFDLELVDYSDSAARARVWERRPRLVWIETPSNPLLRITDVERVASEARQVGAIVVADNTFLSPVWQNPLALGADVVVHSTTKYLNGHSDVVGGSAIARDPDLGERLAWSANCLGITGAPFDAFLTLRGLRTLHARMRLHEAGAEVVARRLAEHPAVGRVYWPGLEDHPGHLVARRQQSGFGAMVSFELSGGGDAVRSFLPHLRCFSLAESLGGVESLVAHPATMTHAAMDPEARRRAGIGDGLVRLSIGIEDPEDLWKDLEEALRQVRGSVGVRSRAIDPERPRTRPSTSASGGSR